LQGGFGLSTIGVPLPGEAVYSFPGRSGGMGKDKARMLWTVRQKPELCRLCRHSDQIRVRKKTPLSEPKKKKRPRPKKKSCGWKKLKTYLGVEIYLWPMANILQGKLEIKLVNSFGR